MNERILFFIIAILSFLFAFFLAIFSQYWLMADIKGCMITGTISVIIIIIIIMIIS